MLDYLKKLGKAIDSLIRMLEAAPPEITPDEARSTKKLRKAIDELTEHLGRLSVQLDPIEHPTFVFDPSNPETVGKIVGQTLLEQNRQALGQVKRFYGSGVYALYYRGPFQAYQPIRGKETPIYVGKADPPTPYAKSFIEQGQGLSRRLTEHAKSIRSASSTLSLDDFDCRFLVVQSGWQKSAEDYLVKLFQPIWNNRLCYGFGKHGDAPTTRSNTRSPWDTLHPGRDWATRQGNKPNSQSQDELIEQIAAHFRDLPPQI